MFKVLLIVGLVGLAFSDSGLRELGSALIHPKETGPKLKNATEILGHDLKNATQGNNQIFVSLLKDLAEDCLMFQLNTRYKYEGAW